MSTKPTKKATGPRKPRYTAHYTLAHELFASPTEPMAATTRGHQLTRMAAALLELMSAPAPTCDAWRLVSDAVNLLETLVLHGDVPVRDAATGQTIASHWRGCCGSPIEIGDTSGLLRDATNAMAQAGERMQAGKTLRLNGPGLAAVRAVLEDYETALETLPARTMMRCHRLTETRLLKIMGSSKGVRAGVRVVAV